MHKSGAWQRGTHREQVHGTSIALAAPTPAQAHAFAERYDLPLPLGFYLAGAGLAVALSFLGSFLLMRPGWRPTLHVDIPVPLTLVRVASGLIRVGALGLLAAAILPTREVGAAFGEACASA